MNVGDLVKLIDDDSGIVFTIKAMREAYVLVEDHDDWLPECNFELVNKNGVGNAED